MSEVGSDRSPPPQAVGQPRAAPPQPQCRFCGTPLPSGVTWCLGCKRDQDWRRNCTACCQPIPENATTCLHCGGALDHEPCWFCGQGIPAGAKNCTHCDSRQEYQYQWMRLTDRKLAFVSTILSLSIGLIGIVAAVGPGLMRWINPHSKIKAHFDEVRTEQPGVVISVVNRGNVEALITGGEIRIRCKERECPATPVELKPENGAERIVGVDKWLRVPLETTDEILRFKEYGMEWSPTSQDGQSGWTSFVGQLELGLVIFIQSAGDEEKPKPVEVENAIGLEAVLRGRMVN